MKGQYMAVESVTTIGLGVILAIGSIVAFSNYQEQVMETVQEQQAHAVESKIVSTAHSLRYAESGEKSIQLPETLGSQDYTVALGEEVQVLVADESYTSRVGLHGKDFEGSVAGGDAKLFKNGNNYILRAN